MTAPAIEFTVGTVWSDSQLVRWNDLRGSSARVGAVFGSRRKQLVGHGRAPGDVPEIGDSQIIRHSRLARKLGIDFLYLLNGLCRHLDLSDWKTRAEILADIEWIVEEVKPRSIVIADPRVASLLRQRYGQEQVKIRVSTIAGVKSKSDLEPWIPFGIDGVVLHHDIGRSFPIIEEIVHYLREEQPGAEVEILVNESCVHGCFAREPHYARLALASVQYVEGFQQNCNIPRLLDPSIILSARWIRPEDLGRYIDLGIRRFKIAGREMSAAWLDRAVTSYLEGRHSGNLVELFTMTPPGLDSAASDIVFLDNRALDGFLKSVPPDPRAERKHLQDLAARLWKEGALQIRDRGSQYAIVRGHLRCLRPGRHLDRLQQLRCFSEPPFKKRVSDRPYGTMEGIQ